MQKLVVERGCIKAISAEVGCDRRTASFALRGAISSPIARQVRALAIAKYNARAVQEVELSKAEIDGLGVES